MKSSIAAPPEPFSPPGFLSLPLAFSDGHRVTPRGRLREGCMDQTAPECDDESVRSRPALNASRPHSAVHVRKMNAQQARVHQYQNRCGTTYRRDALTDAVHQSRHGLSEHRALPGDVAAIDRHRQAVAIE